MNRYWYVLRTYLSRLRFWIMGGAALFFLVATRDDPYMIAFTTIPPLFTGIVAGLMALHVRRQFGTPQSKLMPGFAGPHIAVGAALLTLLWLALPLWFAASRSLALLPTASAHAVAPVMFALVVWWPRTIVLLAMLPVLMGLPVTNLLVEGRESLAEQFVSGKTIALYVGFLSAAVVAYPLSAWRLVRLGDLSLADSDDFSFEPSAPGQGGGVGMERLSQWRDDRIEWLLGRPRGRGATVGWRRVPSTVSWPELALIGGGTLALMPLVWLVSGTPAAARIVMMVGTAFMVFAPLSLWRFRCNALAGELMRPASRTTCVRQLVLAMLLDCATWCAAGTVVLALGYAMLLKQDGFSPYGLLAHTAFLWGMGMLIYGLGMLTLRFRYWMPLFVTLYLGCLGLGFLFTAVVTAAFTVDTEDQAFGLAIMIGCFSAFLALTGLLFAWITRRRWVKMDVA